MKKGIFLAVLLILAAALLSWIYFVYLSDEARIRREVEDLAVCGSRTENDGAVRWAMKMSKLGDMFTPGGAIVVSLDEYSESFTPETLCSQMGAYFNAFKYVTVKADDIKVVVNGDTASARFEGELEGQLKEGRKIDLDGNVEALFVKRDRKWKIISLRIDGEEHSKGRELTR